MEAYSSPHGIGVYRYGSLPPDLDKLMREQAPDHGYAFPRGPTDPHHHIQIRIEITLGYTGPLAAEPIIPALLKLTTAAQAVINLFDN